METRSTCATSEAESFAYGKQEGTPAMGDVDGRKQDGCVSGQVGHLDEKDDAFGLGTVRRPTSTPMPARHLSCSNDDAVVSIASEHLSSNVGDCLNSQLTRGCTCRGEATEIGNILAMEPPACYELVELIQSWIHATRRLYGLSVDVNSNRLYAMTRVILGEVAGRQIEPDNDFGLPGSERLPEESLSVADVLSALRRSRDEAGMRKMRSDSLGSSDKTSEDRDDGDTRHAELSSSVKPCSSLSQPCILKETDSMFECSRKPDQTTMVGSADKSLNSSKSDTSSGSPISEDCTLSSALLEDTSHAVDTTASDTFHNLDTKHSTRRQRLRPKFSFKNVSFAETSLACSSEEFVRYRHAMATPLILKKRKSFLECHEDSVDEESNNNENGDWVTSDDNVGEDDKVSLSSSSGATSGGFTAKPLVQLVLPSQDDYRKADISTQKSSGCQSSKVSGSVFPTRCTSAETADKTLPSVCKPYTEKLLTDWRRPTRDQCLSEKLRQSLCNVVANELFEKFSSAPSLLSCDITEAERHQLLETIVTEGKTLYLTLREELKSFHSPAKASSEHNDHMSCSSLPCSSLPCTSLCDRVQCSPGLPNNQLNRDISRMAVADGTSFGLKRDSRKVTGMATDVAHTVEEALSQNSDGSAAEQSRSGVAVQPEKSSDFVQTTHASQHQECSENAATGTSRVRNLAARLPQLTLRETAPSSHLILLIPPAQTTPYSNPVQDADAQCTVVEVDEVYTSRSASKAAFCLDPEKPIFLLRTSAPVFQEAMDGNVNSLRSGRSVKLAIKHKHSRYSTMLSMYRRDMPISVRYTDNAHGAIVQHTPCLHGDDVYIQRTTTPHISGLPVTTPIIVGGGQDSDVEDIWRKGWGKFYLCLIL